MRKLDTSTFSADSIVQVDRGRLTIDGKQVLAAGTQMSLARFAEIMTRWAVQNGTHKD